jgi:hypothetical protein
MICLSWKSTRPPLLQLDPGQCSFFCMEAFVANCQSAFQMKSSKIIFCPALSTFTRGLVFWVTLIICCLVMKFCVGCWLCGVFVFELLLEACHDGGLDHIIFASFRYVNSLRYWEFAVKLCHTRIGCNLTTGINNYDYLQCFQGLADCTGTSKAIFFFLFVKNFIFTQSLHNLCMFDCFCSFKNANLHQELSSMSAYFICNHLLILLTKGNGWSVRAWNQIAPPGQPRLATTPPFNALVTCCFTV